MHVFPFSPRPDTPLFKAKDRVPESVRDERAKRLRDLSDELYKEYLMRQSGKPTEVVLQSRKGGSWYGLSGNYLEVKVLDAPLFAREGLLVQANFAQFDEKTSKPVVICHA